MIVDLVEWTIYAATMRAIQTNRRLRWRGDMPFMRAAAHVLDALELKWGYILDEDLGL